MISWLLLIILLLALTVLGTWFWGSVFGRGELLAPLDPADTREANLRAVAEGDIDAVQFEIVPRGYRPEQVDEVIAALVARLPESKKD
ncbi:DivIVA domain-containing protein [Corynebacterium nasicanis]|uniref:DivIVA domain-containing protein n=1 Tax=Corynebacterium nasicanis TaxID=1448267 RepID=A0ABW1QC05_9CORY